MPNPLPPKADSELATHSSVRTHSEGFGQSELAQWRVTEFLRAHGLTDVARLEHLSGEIVRDCKQGSETLAQDAVALAQQRVHDYWQGVLPGGRSPHPLWSRTFTQAHPDLFLGDLTAARQAAERFGDPFSGEPPRRQPFPAQELRRALVPSWLLGLLVPLALTSGLAALMLNDLGHDGLSALELIWGLIFSAVFFLPAVGMTTAALGFFRARRPQESRRTDEVLPRTALLMPVYHEDSERVFATIAGMRHGLHSAPQAENVDLFVLSDSRDLQVAADEDRAFRRVSSGLERGAKNPIYYRRRAHNDRQKSGNLAEFLERFGDRYTYVIVLDADSLMSARTVLELIRRMEDEPRLGLLQAALMLRGGESLLARSQQFVTSVCGPIFTRGLARWAGPYGNYYGHNAILRVSAFMECAGLPSLSGGPPFGGHLLSHDFVEAALLCRGGYAVRTAWDLEESWEEMPQSLREYAARDRRWCQGNLQHMRIVLAQGLQPMSRIHFVVGALSFLTAPLLLLFAGWALCMAALGQGPALSVATSTTLLVTTLASLLVPRLLGVMRVLADAQLRRRHGGAVRVVASAVLEGGLSALLAPVLIAHHTFAVLGILLGRTVTWGKRRDGREQARWLSEVVAHVPNMLLGCGLLAVAGAVGAGAWPFLLPIALPMAASVPLALLFSHPAGGTLLKRFRLLATPAEIEPHPIMEVVDEQRSLTRADPVARFRDVVLDPLLLAAHLDRLPDARPEVRSDLPLEQLVTRVLRSGPTGLTAGERAAVLADRASLTRLHREAWRRWPVERWDMSRHRAQLPAPLPSETPSDSLTPTAETERV